MFVVSLEAGSVSLFTLEALIIVIDIYKYIDIYIFWQFLQLFASHAMQQIHFPDGTGGKKTRLEV